MNIYEMDILNILEKTPFTNQRILAEFTGHSVGVINKSLKSLIEKGYLNTQNQPTEAAHIKIKKNSPERAIILAAGVGMRMIPINNIVPKALLQVKNEPLIERIIKFLHLNGINEIHIVTGFMKESLEYLIDEYGVDLIVNPEYAEKNNLHSLYLARYYLENCYIIPADIWLTINPFSKYELYSWYMVSNTTNKSSPIRINRKKELVVVNKENGNTMIGIAYISQDLSTELKVRLEELDNQPNYYNAFWETSVINNKKMLLTAKIIKDTDAIEINTYEQLRELDEDSSHLKSEPLNVIAKVFNIKSNQITNISVLKKGMTNRSFLFSVNGNRYIMRIPGEGTDQLINRRHESEVYKAISGLGLCDDPLYFDCQTGYKITKFLNNVRSCNPDDITDITICMKKLKDFHNLNLKVQHTFDIFKQIEFYESLWNGNSSAYIDYYETKKHVLSLQSYINSQNITFCLTHIDAVPDNFLFYESSKGEQLQLTDWEYAGMQDPHVDIAMFCIYSLYDKNHVDRLIDIYFNNNCDKETRIKIYCYIAACGLLWSNWCEYKRQFGVEFGDYSLRQYRFAKEYYRFAMKEMEKDGI